MRKILTLIIVACFTLLLVACNSENKDEANSYVNLEINPGVEFVVDGNGKVVAANGTNEDGKTLILNVSFEGLDLESAINVVLTEAEESGYLLSATYNSELVTREIKVSIDSETSDGITDLNKKVSETVNKFIVENDIEATYTQLQAKGREHLEAIVKKYNPMLTDEEIKALSYKELLELVELATIEKAQMASVALEEYYLSFKEVEFKFAYKQEVAAKLNELNPIIAAGYNVILKEIKASIDRLNELEYNIYVSEDSNYLKLLNQLNGYKDEVIKLNAQLAVNENVTEINAEIKVKKELIEKNTKDIETVMNTFKATFEVVRNQLNSFYDSLTGLEEKITNLNFEEILTNVEVKVNNAKDGLCESFESAHADEIASINARIAARKEALEGKTE